MRKLLPLILPLLAWSVIKSAVACWKCRWNNA